MEANSKNFSILVENEEQFNRVWNYVRWYHPTQPEIDYNANRPIAVIFKEKLYQDICYFTSLEHYEKFITTAKRITWEQFLEYEKEIQKAEMKEQKFDKRFPTSVELSITKQIVERINDLNELLPRLPDNEALHLKFNSDGKDISIYFDNLTKFTSVKSIFGGEELL